MNLSGLAYPNELEPFLPDTFACDFCTRSYSSPGLLVRHATTHCAPSSLSCPACSRPFHRKEALFVHMRKAHANEALLLPEVEVAIGSFPCTICGRKFQSRPAVSAHVQSYHINPHSAKTSTPLFSKSFTLEVPFGVSIGREEYRVELALPPAPVEQPEDRYDCGMCAGHFKSADMLKVHSQVLHGTAGVMEYDFV